MEISMQKYHSIQMEDSVTSADTSAWL